MVFSVLSSIDRRYIGNVSAARVSEISGSRYVSEGTHLAIWYLC